MRFETLMTHRTGASGHRPSGLFSGCDSLTLLPAANGFCRIDRAMLGPISVGRVRSTGHEVDLSEHVAVSLVVPFSGRLVSAVGETGLSARPGEALLFSPNRRQTRVVPEADSQFLGAPITLPVETLEDAANRLDTRIRCSRFGSIALALGGGKLPELDELLGLVRVLVSELERARPGWRVPRPA
ncbi:hypothetical protein [Rhodovulum sp. ES.010]|uniref:AraC-like ligand-binding domain-containing protein n=1 Tax=Rhodovulum sp. ES.010 TaxID=1882821 RepID=UPI0009412F26|nr:hypothetical protein [Rhodovulum sp. ES.010]